MQICDLPCTKFVHLSAAKRCFTKLIGPQFWKRSKPGGRHAAFLRTPRCLESLQQAARMERRAVGRLATYFVRQRPMRLLLPACGEKVGMRGLFGRAQNRGGAPSPDCFAIRPLSSGVHSRATGSRLGLRLRGNEPAEACRCLTLLVGNERPRSPRFLRAVWDAQRGSREAGLAPRCKRFLHGVGLG